jgi:2,5-furandicarboxylate decarboxylase 1
MATATPAARPAHAPNGSSRPQNLRTFLDEVRARWPEDFGVVEREVDPRFEVTGLLANLERHGKFPIVEFRHVRGSKLPLVINVFGTYDRCAMAMGQPSVWDAIQSSADREADPIPTHEASAAPVQEVVLTGDQADLSVLPITTHNELDAGAFVCSGATIVKDPDSGLHNLGIYRHQVHGPRELGYFVNPSHHGNYVRVRYEELDRPMPVAIAVGHHPAMLLAAAAQTPRIGGEYEMAGGIMGESVGLVKAVTQDIMVPAEAEVVIEGQIDPRHVRDEGPFGEYPWYYTGLGDRPVITVTGITMRRDATWQDINAAHPEHNCLGMIPKAGSIWRRIKDAVPHATKMNLPMSGCARLHCYISLKKRADGEPKQAAFAAFAAFAAEANLKMVVLVDDDIDVFNEPEVLWAVATRFQADQDLSVIPNALGAHLDPTAFDITRLKRGAMSTKLIVDATKPVPPADFPKRALVPAAVVEKMNPDEYLRLGGH